MQGANYQHQVENNEKELFYSCYIPGMKSYFKGMTKKLGIKKVMKIERELEQSDTKRLDLKRVLLRFEKQHMLGFRLDCNPPPDYVPP